jgi:CCR4-NOT transcription complex subunit 3
VDQGILAFDEVYDKVKTADTQPLKEKYEEELKKEIKKLQRCRDQIKVWGASAEVKNKVPLQESRKLIERRMEAFKVVERETKMKAFSKEGLARDMPMSAEERKRLKCREWVQDILNKLSDSVRASAARARRGAPAARPCTLRCCRAWHAPPSPLRPRLRHAPPRVPLISPTPPRPARRAD